ncbi:MAG: DNA integrity scanning diadenylate cyclase DisA [Nanoarchaeota archaeon]|nr:DNA integrity scanning diadenylate cyclase DisA [Nanoarchaeota archaeon]
MKKEVQQTILKSSEDGRVSEEEFYLVLKLVSPGTGLRTALDGIISSGKGALIAVENDFLNPLIDGGFKVNSKFTHQKLVELSKMDGAIILSRDLKRINLVNVLLTPDNKIKTFQTGTRHKAGERTAKQISGLVIAVSERKKEITIFYKNKTYKLKDTSEILRKVNEYFQILEKQRELFDSYLENLNRLELRNYVSLNQVIKVIQKGKAIQKISKELVKYLIELGNEGKLLEIRLREILYNVVEETNLIIRDYSNIDYKKSIDFLDNLLYEELLEKERILKALNHESAREIIFVHGWRMLSKMGLNEIEISEIIKEIGFGKIISANLEDSPDENIISKEKFTSLKMELEKIKLGI